MALPRRTGVSGHVRIALQPGKYTRPGEYLRVDGDVIDGHLIQVPLCLGYIKTKIHRTALYEPSRYVCPNSFMKSLHGSSENQVTQRQKEQES
jgi:hypothetical protein